MEQLENFDQYQQDLLNDIHLGATIDGELPGDYFFEDSLAKLVSMGDIVDPIILPTYKKIRNNKIMYFDAYCYDDSDKSFVLISYDFSDEINSMINKSDIDTRLQRMLNFVIEASENRIFEYFDETDDRILIANDLKNRLLIDYQKSENDNSIDKIKLYIITNKVISDRAKSYGNLVFKDKKIESHVWDSSRFYQLYLSGKDREPIIVETAKYGFEGIPFIKADMVGNIDYDAYLAIIPGVFLHKIYYDFGSKLLEGNVRAFLSNRGKINKGIRNTIKKEPTKFFAYNNGIACTAMNVSFSEDGKLITKFEDLQIINGGQTTASLTSAVLKDKMSLDNIFVPMKLTVVKDEDYDLMIANISKYANSQNPVKEADLFSNHPFHRSFELLSKKIQTPIVDVNSIINFWYYERSRGKYEQDQFKLRTKSEINKFKLKYPKSQVIKKEELAKYYLAGDSKILRPDIVSKGSAKCMSYFAEYIDNKFQKNPEFINEEFFKYCIALTILFRQTDKIVSEAPWYEKGINKLNIVPYSVSKLISSIPVGYFLDYNLIWKKQSLYPELVNELEKLTFITKNYVQNSGVVIVTEYCKKEETWMNFKQQKYSVTEEFKNTLITSEIKEEHMKASEREKKLESTVNIEIEIYKLGKEYWLNLLNEGKKRGILSSDEEDLLRVAANAFFKAPSNKQCKFIWQIRKKLENSGIIV